MQELSIERLNICKECPIYEPRKKVCNSALWFNPETNEVSTYAKVGYVRGCGCHLEYKVNNRNNHCIAGKW